MRVAAVIAALLMALAAAAMILPTGGGIETSIAFQRTDVAAVILALSLVGLALAVWSSTAGVVLGAIGVGVAFAAMSLSAANPLLGGLARLYIFVGPGLALGFGLILRMASMQAPQFRSIRPRQPAPPPFPEVAMHSATAEPRLGPGVAAADKPAPESVVEAAPVQPAADPYVDEDAKNRLEFLKMRAAETEDASASAALWREIADEYPDYHPAMNAEAQLLFQLGRIPEARAGLEASLEAAPDDPTTLSLAARYAASDKDFAAAERYWAEAFQSHDMNDGQAAAYVNALVQQEKFDEASVLYHRFANDWPERPRLIRAGASAAEGRGDYAEAHELWQAALALEPNIFSDARRSIAALIALGDLNGAARETRSYMQDAPDEPEPKALADRIVRMAITSDSADAMEPVAILGVQNPAYWASWIESRLAAGDIVQAEAAFQQAAERGTDDPALLRAGALIALRAQRRDVEAERWSALVALTPSDLGAVRRAAVAFSALGELEAAARLIEGGLEYQPDHMALLSLKANIAARRGRWADALHAWKAYGEQHELTPNIIAQTGRALRGLNRLNDARAIIQAGLKDAPDNADLIIENAHLADARAAEDAADSGADGMAERLTAWKSAVQTATKDPAAWQGLTLTLLDGDNVKGAKATLSHARSSLDDMKPLFKNRRIRALGEEAGRRDDDCT